MPVYQVNMQKVREREDMEDGYIYLERVPYRPNQGGTVLHTSTVKSSPKPPVPIPKVLPHPTANTPNDQTTPVTNTSHGRPQQTCLQTAFTRVFAYQAVMAIFGTMHEVAVKVYKAGRVMCKMRSSTGSADDAGNPIHGVMNRSSAMDTFSASTLQLYSRDEDDFIVLSTIPHEFHDEEDFVMVNASPAPASKDDDFIIVDAVPLAEPSPTNPIDLPSRTYARFLVRSLLF